MKGKCDFFSSIILYSGIMLSCCILLHAHINCYYAYSLYLQIILTWLNEEALGTLFIKHFIYSELFACPMLSSFFKITVYLSNISLVQWFHLFSNCLLVHCFQYSMTVFLSKLKVACLFLVLAKFTEVILWM